MVAALFPKKDSIEGIERLAFSIGLSIAAVSLIGYLLHITPWGIRVEPFLFIMTGFIVAMVAIAVFRRWKLPTAVRFEIKFRITRVQQLLLGWQQLGGWHKLLNIFLVISISGAISATVFMISTTGESEPFSEFLVLGSGGKAMEYPNEMVSGEEGEVILNIVNHEQQTMEYWMEVVVNEEDIEKTGPITLNNEGKWEQGTLFVFGKPGLKQKVEFRLYRQDDREPYLTTYLLIDVIEE